MDKPKVLAYIVHGPPKFVFGSDPGFQTEIRSMGAQVLAASQQPQKCRENFLRITSIEPTPDILRQRKPEKYGESIATFDCHCRLPSGEQCGSTGSIFNFHTWHEPQLKVDPQCFNWLPSQGIFGRA